MWLFLNVHVRYYVVTNQTVCDYMYFYTSFQRVI